MNLDPWSTRKVLEHLVRQEQVSGPRQVSSEAIDRFIADSVEGQIARDNAADAERGWQAIQGRQGAYSERLIWQ